MKPSTYLSLCLAGTAAAQTPALDLINSVLNPDPEAPKSFSSFASEIYLNAVLNNVTSGISTNYDKLQASAEKLLDPEAYGYVVGGAGLETTMAANREAFDKWKIIPRMLQEVYPMRNLSTKLFGKEIPAPVVMAPVGVQNLVHKDGEKASAKAFGKLGLPWTLSTAASTGFADAAEANGEGNPRWYQLYWPTDDDLTESYLKTAKKNGFDVLVVTVDAWDQGWRTRDLDAGFFPFAAGVGVQIGLEDPVAHKQLGFNPLAENATVEQKLYGALYHVLVTSRGTSPTWAKLPFLRKIWGDGPIVIKGIQSVRDAQLAVEHGADGIIVSNHGGRQVDGAIGSLDTLEDIVEAVGKDLTVGFDSGIRCGADIFKAIALGADFVQLGRPILWGMAHKGADGAEFVLRSLLGEFESMVGLAGIQDLKDITKEHLQKV